jgi:diguanylate cyclase (GGDEF)-like protein/PAS domain S-box-containing protein
MDASTKNHVCSAVPGEFHMQNSKDLTLRLMIIDDSGESAETIVTCLRNGGMAVRPSRANSQDEIDAILTDRLDLVLYSQSQALTLQQTLQRIAASGKDIPLILLVSAIDEDVCVDASMHGIHAIAVAHRPEHLLSVVINEVADLQQRRNLREIETQLHETERRCDALIASSRDPIAFIHEGMHIRANEAYLEMFGFESFEEVEGMSLLDMIAPKHLDEFKNLLKSMSRGEPPPAQYKLDARNVEGGIFPATMEFTTANYQGEPCIQIVFRHRDELDPELAREVEELRQRDQVTGLLNRQAFMAALENAVAQASRGQRQYGLLLVEPDHYSRILPDLDLHSSDILVAAMATHLSALLDIDITTARTGEKSFAVLLEGDHKRTAMISSVIHDAFANHVFNLGERSSTVTVSIGGVQIGEKNASIAQVLKRASESLRNATDLGGNLVTIFDPGAADRAEEDRTKQLIEQLRHSLTGEGFSLHYQPVISLHGDAHEMYQVFLRAEHNGEPLSPATIIEVAEEHGLIGDIDRWIVEHAIAAIGERLRAGHATNILVRIGPAAFADPRLPASIRQQLLAHNVPGSRLWLQTSESKVFTHLHSAKSFLDALTPLGCKIGLEHFGSGLDSFQLLSQFRPAFVKLDRTITAEVAISNESMDNIRQITQRAQSEGIITFAEFVTNAASMSSLFNAGLDYVQGEFVAPTGASMNYEF